MDKSLSYNFVRGTTSLDFKIFGDLNTFLSKWFNIEGNFGDIDRRAKDTGAKFSHSGQTKHFFLHGGSLSRNNFYTYLSFRNWMRWGEYAYRDV